MNVFLYWDGFGKGVNNLTGRILLGLGFQAFDEESLLIDEFRDTNGHSVPDFFLVVGQGPHGAHSPLYQNLDLPDALALRGNGQINSSDFSDGVGVVQRALLPQTEYVTHEVKHHTQENQADHGGGKGGRSRAITMLQHGNPGPPESSKESPYASNGKQSGVATLSRIQAIDAEIGITSNQAQDHLDGKYHSGNDSYGIENL